MKHRHAGAALGALLLTALLAGCDAGGAEPAEPAEQAAQAPDEAAAIGGPAAGGGGSAPPYRPGPPLANPGQTAPAPRRGVADLTSLGHDRGQAEAPVKIVEFSDFGCGYCRQFHLETWPALEREYVETGKVEWKTVMFDVGMFPNSREAALAGECAGEQERFDAMREPLFRAQREWKAAGAPMEVLRGLAEEAELDLDRFQRCMAQGWVAERVRGATELARQLGVRGTPTFFVIGYGAIPGALPLDKFREALDQVHARATGGQP